MPNELYKDSLSGDRIARKLEALGNGELVLVTNPV